MKKIEDFEELKEEINKGEQFILILDNDSKELANSLKEIFSNETKLLRFEKNE